MKQFAIPQSDVLIYIKYVKDFFHIKPSETDIKVCKNNKLKTSLGTIVFPEDGNPYATGKALIKEVMEIQKKYLSKTVKITEKSLFSEYPAEELSGLDKNGKMLQEIEDIYSENSISKILLSPKIENNKIYDNLTLVLKPVFDRNGNTIPQTHLSNLSAHINEKYDCDKILKEDELARNLPVIDKDEEVTDIVLSFKKTGREKNNSTMIIGKYLKDRNIAFLYFNPFNMFLYPLRSKIPTLLIDINNALGKAGVKTKDVEELKRKIFIKLFTSKVKEKLASTERHIKETTERISNYERSIGGEFSKLNSLNMEKNHLEALTKNSAEIFVKELKELDHHPFLEKYEISEKGLILKFKPTNLVVRDFKRIDTGKSYGKRTMFLGSITMEISPNNIIVTNDYPMKEENEEGFHYNNSHPHSSDRNGNPCFGDGDGRRKIYEFLNSGRFGELSKILWFWVNTFKNGGAYAKMWDFYDDRLRQGLPVLDEKGNRITLNDKERIKTGEQKSIKPASNYKENIEKFSEVKIVS